MKDLVYQVKWLPVIFLKKYLMGERNVKQKLNWSLPKNFKVYRDRKRMPSGLWQLIYLLTENYLCKCLNSLVR